MDLGQIFILVQDGRLEEVRKFVEEQLPEGATMDIAIIVTGPPVEVMKVGVMSMTKGAASFSRVL